MWPFKKLKQDSPKPIDPKNPFWSMSDYERRVATLAHEIFGSASIAATIKQFGEESILLVKLDPQKCNASHDELAINVSSLGDKLKNRELTEDDIKANFMFLLGSNRE